MKHSLPLAILLTAFLCFPASPSQAEFTALPYRRITPFMTTQLKKLPGRKCPTYVLNAKSGLANSLLPKTTLCLDTTDLGKKLLKSFVAIDFPLDGRAKLGSPFVPVAEPQQGDMQTSFFTIMHYPAISHYNISDLDSAASFWITLMDSSGEPASSRTTRTRGSDDEPFIEGDYWNIQRGTYYLRFETDNVTTQPAYQLTPGFLEPYEGYPITASDMKDAGVKLVRCPRTIIDLRTGHLVYLKRGYICSKSSTETISDAGFTIAPYSLANGLFLAQNVDACGQGDGAPLPFRVTTPTVLSYETSDPSEEDEKTGTGRGTTIFTLVDLASGKSKPIAQIRGTAQNNAFYLNVPGEYYIKINTSPYNADTWGDISWSVQVEGS